METMSDSEIAKGEMRLAQAGKKQKKKGNASTVQQTDEDIDALLAEIEGTAAPSKAVLVKDEPPKPAENDSVAVSSQESAPPKEAARAQEEPSPQEKSTQEPIKSAESGQEEDDLEDDQESEAKVRQLNRIPLLLHMA